MLEKMLAEPLQKIRSESLDRQTKFNFIRDWFTEHNENFVESFKELGWLVELPNEERYLLTYPLIGNWYLDRISEYQPENDVQERGLSKLKDIFSLLRFENHHMEKYSQSAEQLTQLLDACNSFLINNQREFFSLAEKLESICRRNMEEVNTLKYNYPNRDSKPDFGHGLNAPSRTFYYSLSEYHLTKKKQISELQARLMVVDDQDPKGWYDRLLAAGFVDHEGLQGYFFDCESALEALREQDYDVILTDLELGEGKMSGEDFIEEAYALQQQKGIQNPLISAFSYNEHRLALAEKKLFRARKVFTQPSACDKVHFSAVSFRFTVERKIKFAHI